MSFDLFYQPRRSGKKSVEKKNPFTGEVQTSLPAAPLSGDDVRAVRGVLAKTGARGPDEFGCFVVELRDGGGADVHASDLKSGCMVALRGLTPDLLRFLHDLLGAADWVLLPALEGSPAIVLSLGQAGVTAD